MPWVRLDDSMGEHRKVKRTLRASRPAIALHFFGVLHCARYLTDGFVEDEYIDEVLPTRERGPALEVLVKQCLWEKCDGGYRIHDYLDFQPSRERVLAQRAADAARKARGRKPSAGSPNGQPADSTQTPGGIQEESVRPVPSRPVLQQHPPTPASGGDDLPPVKPPGKRKTDLDTFTADMQAWGARHFPGAELGAVAAAVDWMRSRDRSAAVTAGTVRDFAASSDVWAAQLGLTESATRGEPA